MQKYTPTAEQSPVVLTEHVLYPGLDVSHFQSALAKKLGDRPFYIDRIYTRLGARERSFACVFPKHGRRKEIELTFNEYEALAKLIKTPS